MIDLEASLITAHSDDQDGDGHDRGFHRLAYLNPGNSLVDCCA